jgi:hypothetical protein
MLATIETLALLFTALALVPAAAHLLELPNKMQLSRDEYLIVQKIYRGWALIGIVVVAALVATLSLAVATRSQPAPFRAAIAASVFIIATQLVFWVFTFPVNRKTASWTILPNDWQHLRKRWEYSHAVSAILNLAAFIATSLAVTWGCDV